ncbi:MAG: hypothetical protein AAF401_11760 [Pseudomonadota bacterium]
MQSHVYSKSANPLARKIGSPSCHATKQNMTGLNLRIIHRYLAKLASVNWPSAAIAVFAIGVGLSLIGDWRPAIWPFTTLGEIYVDSPEVYTRERLVNDRYDQDHWLRTQLENLDSDPKLIATIVEGYAKATIGGDGKQKGNDGANGNGSSELSLAFAQQFQHQLTDLIADT